MSKHVALVGELSRLVEQRKLLETSELEQSLAANESHSQDFRVPSPRSSFRSRRFADESTRDIVQAVQAAIESGDEISSSSKLRLAILYALRYQKFSGNQISHVVESLRRAGVEDAEVSTVSLVFRINETN